MEEELSNFLHQVTEVGSIVQGLCSKDKMEADISCLRADMYLGNDTSRTTIDETKIFMKSDRTVINQAALAEPQDPNTMSQEAFMKSCEKDAKERSEDRRLRKQVSDGLKLRANKAYREGEYEKALNLYNKAIAETRDSCLLYTNRALTYLQLRLYPRAIEDCDLVLRLNEASLKAQLYKARALREMGDTTGAEQCLQEAIVKHSDMADYIREYQSQWDMNK